MKRVIRFLSLYKASKWSCYFAEAFEPTYTVVHKNMKMYFCCRNNVTRWRLDTYFTKEPETIEWIDSFRSNETLFDIGANIGLYSIYAAKKGINVVAFEPESQNYALLNRNIFLNKCEDRIMSLNLALSDKDSLDYLYLQNFYEGAALNCFGKKTDEEGNDILPVFKQGVISYSLDSFLLRFPGHFPSHIKVDVDGLEPEIVQGADKTLSDARLKSILIEIDESSSNHLSLIKNIESHGFVLSHKKHAEMFEKGRYRTFFNYVFVRAAHVI